MPSLLISKRAPVLVQRAVGTRRPGLGEVTCFHHPFSAIKRHFIHISHPTWGFKHAISLRKALGHMGNHLTMRSGWVCTSRSVSLARDNPGGAGKVDNSSLRRWIYCHSPTWKTLDPISFCGFHRQGLTRRRACPENPFELIAMNVIQLFG